MCSWWWHCTAEGKFLIPLAHSSEISESATVSHQDLGLEGEFLLERAAEKVLLAASHLNKLLCVCDGNPEIKYQLVLPECFSLTGKNELCEQGALSCTEMWGWQCLCGLGISTLWLGVCSTECVTSRNDEWHCWLCIAIALPGYWEMLGCGGGIPRGKATLICLNLRDNAFPSFEIQHFSDLSCPGAWQQLATQGIHSPVLNLFCLFVCFNVNSFHFPSFLSFIPFTTCPATLLLLVPCLLWPFYFSSSRENP